jgi:hypothetical protein
MEVIVKMDIKPADLEKAWVADRCRAYGLHRNAGAAGSQGKHRVDCGAIAVLPQQIADAFRASQPTKPWGRLPSRFRPVVVKRQRPRQRAAAACARGGGRDGAG